MFKMMVQFQVKDFEAWRKVYDSLGEVRKSRGVESDEILRDVSNPNKIVLYTKWKSLEEAKKWGASPDLRAAQEKGGVVGAPEIHYLTVM